MGRKVVKLKRNKLADGIVDESKEPSLWDDDVTATSRFNVFGLAPYRMKRTRRRVRAHRARYSWTIWSVTRTPDDASDAAIGAPERA